MNLYFLNIIIKFFLNYADGYVTMNRTTSNGVNLNFTLP